MATTTAPPRTRTVTTTASPHSATSPAPSKTATAPATSNARLPARFVITAHGSLNPPSVSAPPGVTIDLTVSSGDGHAHQVVLHTASPRSLAVPAGGQASLQLKGLANGNYALQVDGAAAGTLVVGAQPGP